MYFSPERLHAIEVMEYFPYPNLEEHISVYRPEYGTTVANPFTESEVKDVIRQVVLSIR